MKKLSVFPSFSDKYDILIDSNINFSNISDFIINKQVLIVTNTTIANLYSREVESFLKKSISNYNTCILEDGEIYKSQQSLFKILDTLLEKKYTRSSTVIIALGGGVIGDIVGFAASIYQRGVDFIQIPTTLLSQVDSSVGGKTAINHPLGKNMIGSFYQPKLVYTSPEFYKTLPQREFISGMAEVVKYAAISADFNAWLMQNIDAINLKNTAILIEMIQRCCQIKANVVAEDEKETFGARAILNFGHTFGHAIEKCQAYKGLRHGEAVGVGMNMALEFSKELALITDNQKSNILHLLNSFNIPTQMPEGISKQEFFEAMLIDKKNSNSKLKFILMKSIGNLYVDTVDENTIKNFLDKFFR